MPSEPTRPVRRMAMIRRYSQLSEGAQVGDYIVEKMHARGGFATVYRARTASDGRRVALKVLHPYLLSSEKSLPRFRREVEAIADLAHPNIVRVLELGELDDGPPFFAMEWLQGPTLDAEVAAHGAYSLAETVAIGLDLCSALAAAHAVGIVHRDLKGSNVVLHRDDGQVVTKLVDFGVAKLVGTRGEHMPRLTSTGTQIGTPHYMPPEQILGAQADIDARTDLYSLGILLYRMLTGAFPFAGDTLPEIEEKHLHALPPSASEIAPVPAAVDHVLRWCLEKNREDRPQSADELAAALRRAVDGAGVATSPPKPRQRAVAVHVQGRIDCPDEDMDDDLLDDFDDRLELCRDELLAAGLKLEVDAANSLLAVGALPEGDGADTERRRILDIALAIAHRLDELGDDDARLGFSVTAHEGDMGLERGAGDAMTLLSVSNWASDETRSGLVATREVLRSVAGSFEAVALDETRSRFSVRSRS